MTILKPTIMKNSITSLFLLFSFSICGVTNAQVQAIFNFDTPMRKTKKLVNMLR
jgi:hypothetical protein